MDKPVPTLGSKLRGHDHVEVVVYHKPTSKRKLALNSTSFAQKETEINEFDMKRAKKEAIKLGTSGFFKYKREKTMTALAVELGATPVKKKLKNYKDLKQLREAQKQKREERLKVLKESCNASSMNLYKKKYARKKEQKSKRDINFLNSYGKVKRS